MIISLKDIFVEYNNRILLNHVDFNIQDNDKIGLIGVNGIGKSTLLKKIIDFEQLSTQHVIYKNNLKIAYLDQETNFFKTEDIIEYVISNETKHHDENIEYQAKTILNQLGISDFNKQLSKLSGGQKKRVALAKTLLQEVDLLILDEPTNHLDSNMINWLENYLIKTNTALIMITHDRYFLENIVNRIVEIDKGYLFEYPGNYSTYLDLKAQRLQSDEATQRKQLSLLKNEHEWIKQGPRARSTKSKDRIQRYNQLKKDVILEQDNKLEIDSLNSRLGKKILEINEVSVGYSNNVLIEDFSYTMKRNERIGIVGLNGSGKSTLLNSIVTNTVIAGKLDFGSTVKIGYFNQHSDDLNDSSRVIDYIKDKAEYIETSDGKISASAMLEQFLFNADQQYSLIEKMSGGEKRRLLLLGVLMKAPNFLVLDEPTNDLDITTLNILEDYLVNFNGVILIVSHDRYFMDKIVDTLWIISDNKITLSNDDYTSYLKQSNNTNDKKSSSSKKEYVKAKKIRFSYQEQKDLETIDLDMELLQQDITKIRNTMNDYVNDYEKLASLQSDVDDLENRLEQKTQRWLELQEKQEQIDNQT